MLMGQDLGHERTGPACSAIHFLRHGAYFVGERQVRLGPASTSQVYTPRGRTRPTNRTPGIPTTR